MSGASEVLKGSSLTAKPDLNVVDVRGFTVMHHALLYGKPPDVAARMVRDAGFDLARWTASLKEAGLAGDLTRRPRRRQTCGGAAKAGGSSGPGTANDDRAAR